MKDCGMGEMAAVQERILGQGKPNCQVQSNLFLCGEKKKKRCVLDWGIKR